MTSGQPPEHPYGDQPQFEKQSLPQYQSVPVAEPGLSGWRAAPRELRPVIALLAANLLLSVVLTIVTLLLRHSLVDYQLDHRHITDPQLRESLRHGYLAGVVGRAIGNIVVSVVYVFLVRALIRGRRWAYRRVIWVGAVGVIALLLVQLTPYPVWMRVEQLVQAVVLGFMVYFVTRPAVRAHFDRSLPGRDVRRFNR